MENSKLKDVKEQKEEYIQVLLTEKQYLQEEIKDLKQNVKTNNKNDSTILSYKT